MKIGILTLKYANNYGGILQSLALQEYLKQLNHDVEIINFKSTLHETIYHRIIYAFFNLIFSHNIISILRDKLNEHKQQTSPDPTNLINKIESFMHKYLNRGELVNENNIEDYCKKFDCIIVGSDQVWNDSILPDTGPYFFEGISGVTKLAYAASFGTNELTETINPHF